MSIDSEEFPHSCTIERASVASSDEVGEPVMGDFETLAEDVICNFQDKGSVIRAGRENIELNNPVCFFRFDQDLAEGDRIVDVATAGTVQFPGPYRVTSIQARPPMYTGDHGHKQVELQQVKSIGE